MKLFRSRSGQVFTIEFAMAAIGIVAIAFVVGAVANWGLGWMGGSTKAFNATRVAAGQEASAGVPAGGPAKGVDLIGPDGPESLGSFNSPVGRSQFTKACDSQGLITDAMQDRIQAGQKLATMPLVRDVAVFNANTARYFYKLANDMQPGIEKRQEMLDNWGAYCQDPPPPPPPPPPCTCVAGLPPPGCSSCIGAQ